MQRTHPALSFYRGGFTTGTCAAAAAKAATMLLQDEPSLGEPSMGEPLGREAIPLPAEVDVALPDGERVRLPVAAGRLHGQAAEAAVRKDAGDDPDITHAALVIAIVRWADGCDVILRAGEGVGTVTKPGLSVWPGEPAINPTPRAMIRAAVREVTQRGIEVAIGIPGGRELAAKTFNPRLGVVGGLSILGTTGRVRAFDPEAMREALRCTIRVAKAASVMCPILVPGHIGWRAARRHFSCVDEQIVEMGNEWGSMLDDLADPSFSQYLVVGHAGKLAKLSEGHWDTHSSRSPSALPMVAATASRLLGHAPPEASTVEGLLAALYPSDRTLVATAVAGRIAAALEPRMRRPVAVALVDMAGERLAHFGDLSPWRKSQSL